MAEVKYGSQQQIHHLSSDPRFFSHLQFKMFYKSTSVIAAVVVLFTSCTPALASPLSTYDINAPPPQIITYTDQDLAPFSSHNLLPAPSNHSTTTLSHRDIIGTDNRIYWAENSYPWGAYGLVIGSSKACTGTLVGDRLVLTAKHCVELPAYFAPSFDNEERFNGSTVASLIHHEPTNNNLDHCTTIMDDWAIMVLDDPVGKEVGFFGANLIDCEKHKNDPIFCHIGYPEDLGGDWRPFFQQGISVTDCNACGPDGPLVTDADVANGQDGGPLWIFENGMPWIYGVLSSANETSSTFTSGLNMAAAINKAREDYP